MSTSLLYTMDEVPTRRVTAGYKSSPKLTQDSPPVSFVFFVIQILMGRESIPVMVPFQSLSSLVLEHFFVFGLQTPGWVFVGNYRSIKPRSEARIRRE